MKESIRSTSKLHGGIVDYCDRYFTDGNIDAIDSDSCSSNPVLTYLPAEFNFRWSMYGSIVHWSRAVTLAQGAVLKHYNE